MTKNSNQHRGSIIPQSSYDGVFTFCSNYVPYVPGMTQFDGVTLLKGETSAPPPEVCCLVLLTNDGDKIICPGESLLHTSFKNGNWKFLLPTRLFAFMQYNGIQDNIKTVQFWVNNSQEKQIYVYDKDLGGVTSLRSLLLKDGRMVFNASDFAFFLLK